MTAEAIQPATGNADPANGTTPAPPATAPAPVREKTTIPKNPGRRDLGMQATLLFPNKASDTELKVIETCLATGVSG